MANQSNDTPQKFTPMSSVLLRMYWFFVGHAVVALLGMKILQEHQQRSVVYIGVLLLAAIATFLTRLIDIKFFNGETGDGRQATMKDFWKWSLMVAVAYGIIFAAIQLSPLLMK